MVCRWHKVPFVMETNFLTISRPAIELLLREQCVSDRRIQFIGGGARGEDGRLGTRGADVWPGG